MPKPQGPELFTEAQRDNVAERLDNINGGITLAIQVLLGQGDTTDELIAARRTLDLAREELNRVSLILDFPFPREPQEVANG